MSRFEDLEVWKMAHELVIDVYKIIKNFPTDERFRIIDQLSRAVVSIPANIAEGTGRKTKKDFIHFLYVSRGSLQETKYLILLSKNLGYIGNEIYETLIDKCYYVSKLLNGLINKMEGLQMKSELPAPNPELLTSELPAPNSEL
ncbi:MAG: four helix bundle protein [Bacillota bacterium]|nr:four helix bundle protein [Bacillota bacterium]